MKELCEPCRYRESAGLTRSSADALVDQVRLWARQERSGEDRARSPGPALPAVSFPANRFQLFYNALRQDQRRTKLRVPAPEPPRRAILKAPPSNERNARTSYSR